MHNLLKRQINRYLGDADATNATWQRFLTAVNDAYEQFDADRILLQRSLELTAQDVLEANSKLRAALESFPDVLFRLDSDGIIVDYAIGRTTEFPLPESVLGKALAYVLQWGCATDIEQTIRQVRQTQKVAAFEHSVVEGDTRRYYEARIAPLLDDQAIVVIRDIGERRRAEEELRARARQQAAVAALGQRGLAERDLSTLLDEAVALVAETLEVEHSTVWELQADGHSLVLRAGVGWSRLASRQDILDIQSWMPDAGAAFRSGEPLVVEDFTTEIRLGGSELAREYGVMSGMFVLIQGRERPFGMLSALSDRRRAFSGDDVHFMQASANVVAGAVARRGVEGQLQQAKDAAEERTRELSALLEISAGVGSLELRPVLGLVLERLKAAIDYSGASISVFENDGMVILDYRGPLPRDRVVGLRLPRGTPAWEMTEEIIRRRGPVITDDLGDESLITRQLTSEGVRVDPQLRGYARSQLGVPLVAQGRVIGSLGVVHGTPGFYNERHARLAMAFAQQAAIAIQNAQLYEAGRERAAMAERQRLARELHDSVSQALYGIALNASSADELFDAAPERTRGLVRDVLRLAEAGLAEMRALIFELRPESLEQEGLVGALEKQAAALQARHGLQVRLSVAEEPQLAPAAKEGLYRVAQEALHNAAKHARARTLDIALVIDGSDVRLLVADDGRGFDPDGDFPGHLGLRSMRERVAAVGGRLQIESAPGAGTRLRASVPLAAPA